MTLSKRLTAIAGLVAYRTLADIGCDHGKLPAYLADKGVVDRAVASDIKPGPLLAARGLVEAMGLEDLIELRLCGGLTSIRPGEVESCVIAGMGGMTIINILSESPITAKSFRQLILSPERDAEELRRYLHGAGFSVKDELIITDRGVFYNVLDVLPGSETPYDGIGYTLGKKLIERKDPVLKLFTERELAKANAVADTFANPTEVPEKLSAYRSLCMKALEMLTE